MTDSCIPESLSRAFRLLGEAIRLVRLARQYIETACYRACPECEGLRGKHDVDCLLVKWLDEARAFLRELAKL